MIDLRYITRLKSNFLPYWTGSWGPALFSQQGRQEVNVRGPICVHQAFSEFVSDFCLLWHDFESVAVLS